MGFTAIEAYSPHEWWRRYQAMRAPLDPAVDNPLLPLLPALRHPWQARVLAHATAMIQPRLPHRGRFRTTTIRVGDHPGDSPSVVRLWLNDEFVKPGEQAPVIVFAHGGAFCFGHPAGYFHHLHRMARATGAFVVAPEYRLAPTHPYPAALHDVLSAARWAVGMPEGTRESNGVVTDPTRLVLAGDSAGGGLAACATAALTAQNVTVAGLAIKYPMLAPPRENLSDTSHVVWDGAANALAWRLYLNGGELDPYVDPLTCALPEHFPRLWLGVGTADVVYPECSAYAERLRKHGLSVDLYVWEGGFHGSENAAPRLAKSRAFDDAWHAFIASACERATPAA